MIEPFPEKLHRLLTEAENLKRNDVISWEASGRAFVIHQPDVFFKEIVPLYFRQTRLSSFKRQLNLYGLYVRVYVSTFFAVRRPLCLLTKSEFCFLFLFNSELLNTGPARGGYYHQDFVKDRPELCRRMRRVAIKMPDKPNKKKKQSEKDAELIEKSPKAEGTNADVAKKEDKTDATKETGVPRGDLAA